MASNELYDRKRLAVAVRAKRGKNTFRAAGRESQIDHAILNRVENEQLVSMDTVVRLALWMGVPVEFFLLQNPVAAEAA